MKVPAIEKDIPMPPRRTRTPTEMIQVLKTMKIGESLFFGTEGEAKNAYTSAHNLKIKTSRRKENAGWRLWRVE